MSEPGNSSTVGVRGHATAVDAVGLRISSTLLGQGRYRWLLGLAAWTVAAVALHMLPFGRELNPYLSATGLLIGFFVGLTGMGGGAALTPVLIFFFGVAPSVAIGTDIAYAAVTKVFGSWRHLRQGSVDKPLAVWLAVGSVPAGILGAWAVKLAKASYGPAMDGVLYTSIGAALVLVGGLIVVRHFLRTEEVRDCGSVMTSGTRKAATVALGAAAGLLIGFTSVGSGTVIGVFLILFYPLATRRVVGTDIVHATILLAVVALAQLRLGNVEPWMVASLLLGSVPGVVVGSHLTAVAPTRLLRLALAAVLVLSGLALFGKA